MFLSHLKGHCSLASKGRAHQGQSERNFLDRAVPWGIPGSRCTAAFSNHIGQQLIVPCGMLCTRHLPHSLPPYVVLHPKDFLHHATLPGPADADTDINLPVCICATVSFLQLHSICMATLHRMLQQFLQEWCMPCSCPCESHDRQGKNGRQAGHVLMVEVAYIEGMLVSRSDCGLWSLSNGSRLDCQLRSSCYEHCSPLPAVKAI